MRAVLEPLVLVVIALGMAILIMQDAAECRARGGQRLPSGECIAIDAVRR